jgi:hypothetical protein
VITTLLVDHLPIADTAGQALLAWRSSLRDRRHQLGARRSVPSACGFNDQPARGSNRRARLSDTIPRDESGAVSGRRQCLERERREIRSPD